MTMTNKDNITGGGERERLIRKKEERKVRGED